MTFTGRIRVYLVAVAVISPLLILLVIYFGSVKQMQADERNQAQAEIERFVGFYDDFKSDIVSRIDELTRTSEWQRLLAQLEAGRQGTSEIDPRPYQLDFLEILDTNDLVKVTWHRPGLVGERIDQTIPPELSSVLFLETTEYDRHGSHPSLVAIVEIGEGFRIYTGRYIDARFHRQVSRLLDAELSLVFNEDSALVFSKMRRNLLYESENQFRVVLAGSEQAGFFLVATFTPAQETPVLVSLLGMTGLVALFSILVAVAIGIYMTWKAKREITNLVDATARVASGDFGTPVMAYEEGEFSQLADSFSLMMRDLKTLRKKLETTEKIAAWETVGRKVAHEIKNPLTPITIGIDDIRHSYRENLPDFAGTLEETTVTMKSEIQRMTRLLDQFVSFARMRNPEKTEIDSPALFDSLAALYQKEVNEKRLVFVYNERLRLFADPDSMRQVLINLIKNGFESATDAIVTVTLTEMEMDSVITIENTGLGFSEEKLRNSFQPYESTKEGGSGLGLVICHRIVHDHSGTLELYNRNEGGGAVKIFLPRT